MSLGAQCRERTVPRALGPLCRVAKAALGQPERLLPHFGWAYITTWHSQGTLRSVSGDSPLHPHMHCICCVGRSLALGDTDQVPAKGTTVSSISKPDFSLCQRGKVHVVTVGIYRDLPPLPVNLFLTTPPLTDTSPFFS